MFEYESIMQGNIITLKEGLLMKKRIFATMLTLAMAIGLCYTPIVAQAASITIDYNEPELDNYKNRDDKESQAVKLIENKTYKGSIGGRDYGSVLGYDGDDYYCVNVRKNQTVVIILTNVSGLNGAGIQVGIYDNDSHPIKKILYNKDPYLRKEFIDNRDGEEYVKITPNYTGKMYINFMTNDKYASTYYTIRVRLFDHFDVNYRTQVQKQGWQAWKKNGELSGTKQDLRLEGIKIKLTNGTNTGGIKYRTYIQKRGWEKTWAQNGEMSGTQGLKLRLEGIQIKLTGNATKSCHVYYRTYVEKMGWLGWAKDGEKAGTAGYAYKLEGIQILIDEDIDVENTVKPFVIKK